MTRLRRFRVVFFIPLMVTPVGIAYTFRMLADMTVGPFAPLWQALGMGRLDWATNQWSAVSFTGYPSNDCVHRPGSRGRRA